MLSFTKMHGLGNDYLVIDGLRGRPPERLLARLARLLSDRHFGIGADGLLLVLPSPAADFRMRVFNADGSEAEMCGNGIRLLARYLHDRKLTRKRELAVETLAGIIRPTLLLRQGRVRAVRVDMGEPRFRPDEIPMRARGCAAAGPVIGRQLRALGKLRRVTCLSMGNPHCVLFVRDVERAPVSELGLALEHHPAFPRRTNVEFVQPLGSGELKMRVWERGAGETLACGTGASAALVAAVLNKKCERKVTMHLRGGDLQLEWRPNSHVLMTGPAEEVCSGTTRLDEKLRVVSG
jgi:diaminopimelate epimerase